MPRSTDGTYMTNKESFDAHIDAILTDPNTLTDAELGSLFRDYTTRGSNVIAWPELNKDELGGIQLFLTELWHHKLDPNPVLKD